MEHRDFDLFELIRILLKNRKLILIIVAVVAVSAVTYSLLTPQIWSSTAAFYAVGSNNSSLPFNLPSIGGLTSSIMNLGSDEASLGFINALKSRSFSEEVIRKFDLINYYNLTYPDTLRSYDIALKKMRKKMIDIDYDDNSGLIVLSIETKDRQLSMDIVNFFLDYLDRYNRELKYTKSKMKREYLENRVAETRALIDSLIIAVRDFQTKHKAIDLTVQSTALISSYSQVIAQRMKSDIDYQLALQNYNADSPIVKQLEVTVKELDKQIRELESSQSGIKPQYLIDISKLPDLGSQYAQLKLNLEIQTKVYEYLYPQYEIARLDELNDMPSMDILDTPRMSGQRVRPKRAMLVIIATILGFILASIVAAIKEIIHNNKDRILQIRQSL